MAMHGSIGTFDGAREDWTSYSERLEQYFVGNNVTAAEKKRAILLSVCGAATYQLIRNIVAPEKPTERTFEQLVELVRRHHNPKPSVIMQRFKFNTCSRQQGQSVATFVAELRHLTEHCEFGDSMEDMLRDRLVCGVNDSRIQRRLLSEPSLTFKKTLELARAFESAEKNARDLQVMRSGGAALPVLQLRTKQEDPCYHCGGKHAAADCRYKNMDCHNCGKRGHLARMCRGRESNRAQPSRSQAHWLRDAEQSTAEYELFHISASCAVDQES